MPQFVGILILVVSALSQGGPITCQAALRQSAPTDSHQDSTSLSLSIASHSWRVGDNLWYTLKLKNEGPKTLIVSDRFWRYQNVLPRNTEMKIWTRFELLGPDGKTINPNFSWGDHGEFSFWTNDDSQFKIEILPGQEMSATPSTIAPIRHSSSGPIADIRAGPPGSSQAAYLQRLQADFDSANQREADPCRRLRIPTSKPDWVPIDARILEGYCLRKSGPYRIRAIYEQISMGSKHSGRGSAGPVVNVIKSAWVTFKVEP